VINLIFIDRLFNANFYHKKERLVIKKFCKALNEVSYSECIMYILVKISNIFREKLLLILEIFRIIERLVANLQSCNVNYLTGDRC